MNFLKKLFGNSPKRNITIVSGLPRSGTSMMMKMLEAGGIPPLTDKIRAADDDNPKGYYEFERVKKLDKGDTGWVDEAQGKSVKVISALLKYLPADYDYKVIFMRRRTEEILASQKQMLVRRGEPTDRVSDDELADYFAKHLKTVEYWLQTQPNVDVLYISYNRVLESPLDLSREVNRFLENRLDMQSMAAVVDPNLYRQKTS